MHAATIRALVDQEINRTQEQLEQLHDHLEKLQDSRDALEGDDINDASDKRKGAWTPERRAAHSALMKQNIAARKTNNVA